MDSPSCCLHDCSSLHMSFDEVRWVAEGDMHLAMAVCAAMLRRSVSGCTASPGFVNYLTRGFVPFSCHLAIQSAHHRELEGLEAQVRWSSTPQMSIEAHMTDTTLTCSVYMHHHGCVQVSLFLPGRAASSTNSSRNPLQVPPIFVLYALTSVGIQARKP